ncbi:hypothetical protein KC19_VG036600 [Ceratodon purpureus]|uniref:Uncharacterized protein n=1 Tax=Ceratodon purpureus TaxID=3225 RepID=A0A8T0HM34_CERPU|nr:hypothetical protein KC19_VG036600 [Ceratodon purpureus]
MAVEKEKAMAQIGRAEDKQIKLKAKHKELVRHHSRAEKNFKRACDIKKVTGTELESAINSAAHQGIVEKLRPLAAISERVFNSAHVQLQRLTEKLGVLGYLLHAAESAAKKMVNQHEAIARRQIQTNNVLERGAALMDAVAEFMETSIDGPD